MMRSTILIGSAAAMLLLAACNKTAGNGESTPPTSTAAAGAAPSAAPTPAAPTAGDFVTQAGATDMFEIAEAKLALKSSQSADVKKFAAMMLTDHTKSTAALKAAIAKSGQTLAPPAVLPTDLQIKVDALKTIPSGDFDGIYLADQVAAHQQALSVMQAYAAGGDVPQLKAFASDTFAVVQKHLEAANALKAKTP